MKLYSDINKEAIFRYASIIMIFLGAGIRIYHFLLNRSLWLDEAMLSNNIINRNFLELLQPLDNRQIAPIGFLYVQKLFTIIFGHNEYALRLFPLITGVLSIITLYLLIKKIGDEKIAFAGLCLFIFGQTLIRYSTEAKQYNVDVLCYIVCFLYLYFYSPQNKSFYKIILLGLFGAILIWFSHITVMILSGIGIAIGIEIIKKKEYRKITKYLTLCFIWLVSFGIYYFLFIADHTYQASQTDSFRVSGYFPPSPFTLNEISWLSSTLIHSIEYPLGINSGILLSVMICVGIYYSLRFGKYQFLTLLLPVLIHIILSFLNIYPFHGRFLIYCSLTVVIFTVLGMKLLITINKYAGLIISGLILITVIIYPVRFTLKPIEWEEIKSSLKFIQDNMNDNDAIYVQYCSVPSFEFYQDKYFEDDIDIIHGKWIRYDLSVFDKEMEVLKKKERVWILLTHYDDFEKNYILDQCNLYGEHIMHFEYGGGSADLFSINN